MSSPIISTTIVTYNRLEYTKKTVESYLKNTLVPHELIVVDNGSTDGTLEYLKDLGDKKLLKALITNSDNKYPGFATNQGWQEADAGVSFLHRSDNDLLYRRGWDKMALQAFKDLPKMGQLGLLNELYQLPPVERQIYLHYAINIGKSRLLFPPSETHNVGGPCLVRKEIFDAGLRWSEQSWSEMGKLHEDFVYSTGVRQSGWEVYEMVEEKVKHLGFGDTEKYFDYYMETYGVRNLWEWFAYRLKIERDKRVKNGKLIK